MIVRVSYPHPIIDQKIAPIRHGGWCGISLVASQSSVGCANDRSTNRLLLHLFWHRTKAKLCLSGNNTSTCFTWKRIIWLCMKIKHFSLFLYILLCLDIKVSFFLLFYYTNVHGHGWENKTKKKRLRLLKLSDGTPPVLWLWQSAGTVSLLCLWNHSFIFLIKHLFAEIIIRI